MRLREEMLGGRQASPGCGVTAVTRSSGRATGGGQANWATTPEGGRTLNYLNTKLG